MLKFIKKIFNKRFDRYYRHKRWRLILDSALIVVIFLLAIAIFSLNFYQPKVDLNFFPNKPSPPTIINFDKPPLKLTADISKTAIYLNEEIELDLTLKNDSIYDIDNIILKINSKNENFSIAKLSLEENLDNNNIEIKNNTVIVNKLEANLETNFILLATFSSKLSKNREINWELNSEYKVAKQAFTIKTSLPDLKVAADLKVQAAAYYNSPQGDQLGAGPLPPLVGLPTNFWIFLRVDTNFDFNDFLISAKLPNNVKFLDNSSLLAGNISFNPDSRQIIWQIKNIEADKENYRAGIELQLIPTNNQVGQFANLLENIRYQAIDNFSELRVMGNIKNVTTALEYDLINQGEGKVEELIIESELKTEEDNL